jgi:hypothetical protein
MPKKGHTEEQIVAVLRQAKDGREGGGNLSEVGISEATYYAGMNSTPGVSYPAGGERIHRQFQRADCGMNV